MYRLFCVAAVVPVALGVLAPVAPASALADLIGGVIIIPGTGTHLDPIRLRTSTGCPPQASAYYATMRGHGFPPDGQVITSTTEAGLSTSIGFDVYVALVMRDYAEKNHTMLAGRYDITVYCIDSLAVESYGEFTGSLEFISPTTYQAIGAAKPPAPPPPPWPMLGNEPAPAPFQPAPSPAAHVPIGQAPGVDSRASSLSERLASQHNALTFQGLLWLIVILAGAALVALIAAAVRRQIRKRPTS